MAIVWNEMPTHLVAIPICLITHANFNIYLWASTKLVHPVVYSKFLERLFLHKVKNSSEYGMDYELVETCPPGVPRSLNNNNVTY